VYAEPADAEGEGGWREFFGLGERERPAEPDPSKQLPPPEEEP
jgi:hypothetical protein